MSSNIWNWVTASPKKRELQDTYNLVSRMRNIRENSPLYPDDQAGDFSFNLVLDICERREITPSNPLGEALFETILHLLFLEGFIIELPDESSIENLTIEEGVELRATLNRHLRFLSDHERLLPLWREKIAIIFSGLLEYFPLSAFTDADEENEGTDDSVILPEARAYDLCDDLPEALDRLIVSFFDADVTNTHLFDSLRERLMDNFLFASGIPREKRREVTAEKVLLPSQQSRKSNEYLVETYFQSTPFVRLFESPLPFAIPFPARFEHTHIMGGTGHGKTQLMQFLINHDLVRAQEDGRSIVVMDSQGDLIRTISRLGAFSPSAAKNLAERFVLIDPNDIEHPVCLNMFDFNRDRLSGYAPVDREKILNATVELYEYFFGALLGADLTQRQGLIFRYLARLMMEIPDATIHTLRELMENSEKFRPYMQRLQGTARSFFETRFFDRQFNETKKQILTRLWGVLSNSSLERMFSHTKNKIDIFELLNQGKIILINTAKDLLGQEGTAIFGRFFISLIAQAVVQRSALPPHERNPSFVYIDEAQDYFDDNISHLLNQARKYRVGLIFAHQNLDQLSAGLRSSVLASTSIKFAGGLSAKDARILDTEFRCDSDFLLAQRKEKKFTEFACYVKNYTSQALSIQIPLGYVEDLPTLSYEDHLQLLENNRALYSAPAMIPEFNREPETPPPPKYETTAPVTPPQQEKFEIPAVAPSPPNVTAPPVEAPAPIVEAPVIPTTSKPKPKKPPKESIEPGGGGRQHKYLQNLIKGLAEQRGFRASIEESILDNTGRVDVSITRGPVRVAFEITVTTNRDHELGNIEKCIAAGYTEIVLVGKTERHVKTLSKFIEENLDEKNRGIVTYISEASIVEYLDSLPGIQDEHQTVRGYKVKVVKRAVDQKDAETIRGAIAEVIARSLAKSET